MSERLSRLSLGDFSERSIVRAKHALIDTIGVGLAGSRTHECQELLSAIESGDGSPGPCSRLGRATRSDLRGAAFHNAIACHILDFDDTCYDGILHASAACLPAALGSVELRDGSGADLLTSYMAGCQAEIEIARWLPDALYLRGWFNTCLFGRFGAAAASARSLGGDGPLMWSSLSLAACDAGGSLSALGTFAKPYLLARAVDAGICAARLAEKGVIGPQAPWCDRRGFARTIAFGLPLEPHARSGKLCFDEPGFAMKLYPVCSAAQAAAECLHEMMQELDLDDEAVQRVEVGATDLVVRSLRYSTPKSVPEAQFSMNFALGCILSFGKLGPSQLTFETLSDLRLARNMGKVRLQLDQELEAMPGRSDEAPEAARVRVVLRDGHCIERVSLVASGLPTKPFSDAQLLNKFVDNAALAGGSRRHATALFETLMSVEKQRSVRALFVDRASGL